MASRSRTTSVSTPANSKMATKGDKVSYTFQAALGKHNRVVAAHPRSHHKTR